MMWMEIPKCSKQRGWGSPTPIPYLPFLASIQREAREEPNNVVLIECKNEYDLGRPASAYEIVYRLGIPTALTVSIEGHGIFPFLYALFIAHFHLRANAASVIVVASPASSVPAESPGGDVKKGETIDDLRAMRLSLQQPAGDSDSLHVIALPVDSNCVPHNLSKIEDANDLIFQSVPIATGSAWLLNPRGVNASPTVLELLSYQPIESKKLKSIYCDSCFDLLKKIPATLASAEMMEKGLLLVA